MSCRGNIYCKVSPVRTSGDKKTHKTLNQVKYTINEKSYLLDLAERGFAYEPQDEVDLARKCEFYIVESMQFILKNYGHLWPANLYAQRRVCFSCYRAYSIIDATRLKSIELPGFRRSKSTLNRTRIAKKPAAVKFSSKLSIFGSFLGKWQFGKLVGIVKGDMGMPGQLAQSIVEKPEEVSYDFLY